MTLHVSLEVFIDSLTAAEIMARSEATLKPDSDIYDARARLLKSRLTGAPVVNDDGILLSSHPHAAVADFGAEGVRAEGGAGSQRHGRAALYSAPAVFHCPAGLRGVPPPARRARTMPRMMGGVGLTTDSQRCTAPGLKRLGPDWYNRLEKSQLRLLKRPV